MGILKGKLQQQNWTIKSVKGTRNNHPVSTAYGHQTHGNFWVPLRPNLIFTRGKLPKMANNLPYISKSPQYSPEKMHETNVYPTILGGVLRGFRSLFVFEHSKSHFLSLEKGHFRQKCSLLCTKNGTKITRIEKTISKWILPKYFGEPSYLLS